jgi:hypothetical protein
LDEDVSDILNTIPNYKFAIIDKFESALYNQYSQVFQDFENDMYSYSSEILHKIGRYKELLLIAPTKAPHRFPIIKGFEKFCDEFKIRTEKNPSKIIIRKPL